MAVPPVLATGVAVIVVVLALALRHQTRHAPQAAPATATQTQTERRQLIQALGVLRRPPTRQDLSLDSTLVAIFKLNSELARPGLSPGARFLARYANPRVDRSLVRVVTIPTRHATVAIEPATWQQSASSPRRSEGIELNLLIGSKPTMLPSSAIGTGPEPTPVSTLLAHGIALAADVRGSKLVDGIVLVPDGISRITLRPLRIIAAPVSIDPSRFGAAIAIVHDNIAAFYLSIPTVERRNALSGTFGTSVLFQATWFDTRGDVIKRTTISIGVFTRVHGS